MTGTIERIVVGHDGSTAAQAAMAWSARFAGLVDGELLVVSVVPRSHDGHRLGMEGAVRDGALDQVRAWIADADIDRHVEASVLEGRPAHELHRFCEQVGARALVIGINSADGPTPWWGSTANELAHLGHVPLVLVPEGWNRSLDRVVVGDDGSDRALAAMRWLAPFAMSASACVRGVRASVPAVEWVPRHDTSSWIQQARREVGKRLAETMGAATTTEVEVVCDAHPVSAILAAGEDLDADLVVVGARGAGGFPALRIGGNALGLVHHTTRPLAIIPS